MSTHESRNVSTNPQDLERVREILFGAVIRDHEARFVTLQRDLERLQKALDKTNEELAAQESSHSKKLQEARQAFQASTEELRAEMRAEVSRLTDEKVNREQLGTLFIEIGNQIRGGGALSSVLDGLLQTSE